MGSDQKHSSTIIHIQSNMSKKKIVSELCSKCRASIKHIFFTKTTTWQLKKWLILIWSKICELTTLNPCILSHLTSCQETDDTFVFVALLLHKHIVAGGVGVINDGWNIVWRGVLNISGQFIKETFSSSPSSPLGFYLKFTQTLRLFCCSLSGILVFQH